MNKTLLFLCLLAGAVTSGYSQHRVGPAQGGLARTAKESAPRQSRTESARPRAESAKPPSPTRRPTQDMAKLRETARNGVRQHQRIQGQLDRPEKGRVAESRMTEVKTRKRNHIDLYSKSGRPFEIKPDTASGRKKGRQQLKRYEAATGRRGSLILYEPQTGEYRFERTPYPTWKQRQTETRPRDQVRERPREVRRPRIGY